MTAVSTISAIRSGCAMGAMRAVATGHAGRAACALALALLAAPAALAAVSASAAIATSATAAATTTTTATSAKAAATASSSGTAITAAKRGPAPVSSSPPSPAAAAPSALASSSALAAPAPADGGGLRCAGQAAAPGALTLALGKSTLMRMAEPVRARSVGNPAVLQAMLVAPDTLYVVGLDIGTSNMIVQGRGGACDVIEVTVGIDPSGLRDALAALLPEQRDIVVSAAADTLVLSGTVSDAQAAARALELAAAFVRRPARAQDGGRGGRDAGGEAAASLAANTATGVATSAAAQGGQPGQGSQGGARIVNFLSVGAPQQVMLEVKIAEVSKSLLDKLEAGTTLSFGAGGWSGALASNFVSGTLRGLFDAKKSNGSRLALGAENQDGLVRILAEPTVMAISGQEGSFLAGGKIFIPVGQENNKVTLEEREFGVGLRFTPTVLAGGRINLRVAPEVSELSREGVGVSASGVTGSSILPLITTRRAATTVELFDGQSFAIGGLIKNNQTANVRGLPLLGELPVLGALFRSADFQQDRTELLFVVTPHLVRPLPPGYKLPTDGLTPPTRAQLFLDGRLEGAPARQ